YYICKDNKILNYLNELKEKYNLNILVKLGNVNNQKIPVLLYHGVLDNTWGAATLFVKPSEFAKQMNYLKENDYTPIFVSEIDYAYAFSKPIIITFDDAYIDVYNNAFPILQTYNFKANIFVITGSIGNNLYMNEEMIKDVDKSNLIEIGSHTISHYKLAEKDEQTIEKELKESKEALEKILNKEINTIAYPSGSFNSTVIKIAQKYYSYGLSTLIGKEQSNNINYFKIKRYYVYREYGLNDFIKLL
ncbi:MAG: polysaccharide deacetylase family protein, partial [Bacilli bacterium]